MAEGAEPESRGGSRRVRRIATNLALVAFGAFMLVESARMRFGSTRNPEPGFWPVIVSGLFLGLTLLLLVTERDEKDYGDLDASSAAVALAVLSLGLFIFFFGRYGFIVPAFLLMLYWLRSLGGESWRLSVAGAALLVAGFHLLFVQMLGVPFPDGMLAVLLGR